jgi:hypothetical protein
MKLRFTTTLWQIKRDDCKKNALNARENQQIDNPSIFSKNKKFVRLGGKFIKGQQKPKTHNN